MVKLKDLPPPDIFYKEPEDLTPDDQAEILSKIKDMTARYRAARQQASLKKEKS
jgi:hypothetical protein